MENIYITVAEGTKPSSIVTRIYEPAVLEDSFEDIIQRTISHTGDELNQEYTSLENELLTTIKETYQKGKEEGLLTVAYVSANDNSTKAIELIDKPTQYADFLNKDSDFLEFGSVEYAHGSIILKKTTKGGNQ